MAFQRLEPLPRRIAVAGHQRPDILSGDLAVDHTPRAAHHNPVGPMRAAQDQCSQRIARARETGLVQFEHRKVRLLADGNCPDIIAPEAAGRPRRRPAQNVLVADRCRAVAQTLNLQCLAGFLHQVGCVLRCRAIDADPDGRPCLFQIIAGHRPEASTMFDPGQWAMPTPALPSRKISSGVK